MSARRHIVSARQFRILWLGAGWGLVVFVLWASFTHHPPPAFFPEGDKLEHGLAYLALMLWFAAATSARRHWRVALALVIMGGLVEWGQALSGYRDPSLGDWLADIAGILLAFWWLAVVMNRLYQWLQDWVTGERT